MQGSHNAIPQNTRRDWSSWIKLCSNPSTAGRIGALVVIAVLASGCVATTLYEKNMEAPPQISLYVARETIATELRRARNGCQAIEVKSEWFAYTVNAPTSTRYTFYFDRIQDLAVKEMGSQNYFTEFGPSNYPTPGVTTVPTHILWPTREDGQRFVDAVQAMKYNSSSDAFTAFQQQATAWRAVSRKPGLPDETHRCRVLAEDAFHNNNLELAVDYYEKGLAVEPVWPDGHFNAALIYDELRRYKPAVAHMKRYLELSPDPKNSQLYRDKLIVWEEKLKVP